MTSPEITKPPRGVFEWSVTVIDKASAVLNAVGTLLIFALVILVNGDVIGRGAFGAPISGVPEIVSMSIVAIVFLQVPQAFRMGRFTRTDAFLDVLQRRMPRLRQALEALYAGAALMLIWFLFSASYPLFEKAWQRGTYTGTVGDFTAPDWPVKLVILVGCAALMLQIAVLLARSILALMQGAGER